jgi:hypothetical protein
MSDSRTNPSPTIVSYDQSNRILSDPILSAQDVSTLDKYYILYWEARYLNSSVRQEGFELFINRETVKYRIVFIGGIDLAYLSANPDNQVRLSFRRIKNRIAGVVLVSRVKGEQNDPQNS